MRHGPAEARGVLEFAVETRGIDQKLLRHAAADHAGAAEPVFLGDHHPRAVPRGDARGAHAARAAADDKQIDVVIGHARHRAEALPLAIFRSAAFDKTNPVRTGENSSPGDADKQAVLHDARHRAKPRRQFRRIGDVLQLCVQQPVPTIRDKSMAVGLRRSTPARHTPRRRRQPPPPGGSRPLQTARSRPVAGSGPRPRPISYRPQSRSFGPTRRRQSSRAATRRHRPLSVSGPVRSRRRRRRSDRAPECRRASSARCPACSAWMRVASEVGTATTSNPARTRSPSRSTKCLAVEPVPSPSRMPGRTNSSARAAAARFFSRRPWRAV